MSLRRFPWKAPRVSDNSYKLFISTPSPGQLTGDGSSHRNSTPHTHSITELPNSSKHTEQPGARVASVDSTEESRSSHHHRHHARPSGHPEHVTSSEGSTSSTEKPASESLSQQQPVIKGPWRLLRLLPRESRNIIGSMLEIDPRKRATLDEILSDIWISSTPVCRQGDGELVCAGGHTHTLEPSAGVAASETQRSSKK
jgi:serine/threonine protein kinase